MSFSLTRKTDYALLALARLSQSRRIGAPGDDSQVIVNSQLESQTEATSARAIAEQFGLPLALLTNVLKDLHAAGLIVSRRGAGGGYLLGRSPDRITLADVVNAIEGRVTLARCCDDTQEPDCPACNQKRKCPITHTIRRFSDAINDGMNRLTLAQLMQEDLNLALIVHPHTAAQSIPLAQAG